MSTLNRTFSVKNGIDIANTIILDSARNLSNVNIAGTPLVTVLGNTYNAANSAANTVSIYANGTLVLANTNLNYNNTATLNVSVLANGTTQTNIAWSANVTAIAGPAYAQANAAYNQANLAYAAANGASANSSAGAFNAANSAANTVAAYANGTLVLANANLNWNNTSTMNVSVTANGTLQTNVAWSANISAITGGVQTALGTMNTNIGAAYSQANAAYAQANSAYGQANLAYTAANTAQSAVTGANTNIAAAYGQANAAYAQANLAYTAANSAIANAAIANTNALAAYGQANLAYTAANNSNLLSGGTITGSLAINGNLIVTGATVTLNVATITTNDAVIFLAANNVADSIQTGFVANVTNATSNAVQTGLLRNPTNKQYYLFDNAPQGNTGNDTINGTTSTLVASLAVPGSGILTIGGATVATQANLTIAYNQANSAYAQANLAYTAANSGIANAAIANTNALAAYGQANLAYTQANNAYTAANSGIANAAIANTNALAAYAAANAAANTVATYANGTLVLSDSTLNFINTATLNVSVTANGSQSNIAWSANLTSIGITGIQTALGTMNTNISAAYSQANSAYGQANLAYTAANNALATVNGNISAASISTNGYAYLSNTVITGNTFTTTNTSQVVIDQFPSAGAGSLTYARYAAVINNSGVLHSTELYLLQDGTNVYMDEIATLLAGASLGTFTAGITSGNVQLLFTPTNATNTVRVARYGMVP